MQQETNNHNNLSDASIENKTNINEPPITNSFDKIWKIFDRKDPIDSHPPRNNKQEPKKPQDRQVNKEINHKEDTISPAYSESKNEKNETENSNLKKDNHEIEQQIPPVNISNEQTSYLNNNTSVKGNNDVKDNIYPDTIDEHLFTFDEAISYVKIWIDYNLIDFTITQEILKWLKQDNEGLYLKFLREWKEEFSVKLQKYKEKLTFFEFSKFHNYLIFLMIIAINLHSKPNFVKLFFSKPDGKPNAKSDFEILTELLQTIKDSEKRTMSMGILNNFFLQEYKTIFFRDPKRDDLEQLFIEEQLNFSFQFTDIRSEYDNQTYCKMFDIWLNFSISYENFFANHKHKIKDEDKPAYKLCISQSVIRIVFSKEKEKCYSSWIVPQAVHRFYEYEFINKIIDKDMTETKTRFGNEYKTLFRKEDLCDDIIKYMFFIFGNTMLIESFIKPVKSILEANPDKDITREDYSFIMSEWNTKWTKTIPNVLKILLKLIYVSVRNHFTIEENNYSPWYTLWIFNYIISPRVQAIYGINSMNSNFIRSWNRLIRNTCYNNTFDQKDQLSIYNDLIEENNKKMRSFIETNIIVIDENDESVKNSLSDLFTEKYLIYPKFLFYWDSELICGSITGGVGKIINYEEIKIWPNNNSNSKRSSTASNAI